VNPTEFDVPSVLRLQHELYHYVRPAATVRDTLMPFLRLLVKRVGGRAAFVFAGSQIGFASLRVRYPAAETFDEAYLATLRSANEHGDWVLDARHPDRHARTWRLGAYGVLALVSERAPLAPLVVKAIRPVLDTLGDATVAAAERERQVEERERTSAVITTQERMLEAIPDAVVRLDSDGRIVATNRAWRVVSGERADRAIGLLLNDYVAPAAGSDQAREAIAEVASGVRQACHLVDVAWHRGDGSQGCVTVRLEGLRDADGRTVGCAGTLVDDAERRTASAELRATRERLSLEMREQRALIEALAKRLDVAHTHLSAVSDAAGWGSAALPAAAERHVTAARDATEGLSAALSVLASVAPDQEGGAATLRAFDIADLVDSVVAGERAFAAQRDAQVATRVRSREVVAARSGLTHALRHLTRAALATTTPGARVDLEVDVVPAAGGAGGDALRAVLRWPSGPSELDDEAAFDRRLGEALVRALSGSLERTLGPEQRLEVRVALAEDAAAVSGAPRRSDGAAVGNAGEGAKVERAERLALIVEDNPINAMVLAGMLTHMGLRSVEVGDGSQAVKALIEHRPDVVMMDINMPVMDGIAATAAIRRYEAQEGLAPVPIIAVTAHAMPGDEARYLEAGMNAYLSKPVLMPQLIALLETHLGQGE